MANLDIFVAVLDRVFHDQIGEHWPIVDEVRTDDGVLVGLRAAPRGESEMVPLEDAVPVMITAVEDGWHLLAEGGDTEIFPVGSDPEGVADRFTSLAAEANGSTPWTNPGRDPVYSATARLCRTPLDGYWCRYIYGEDGWTANGFTIEYHPSVEAGGTPVRQLDIDIFDDSVSVHSGEFVANALLDGITEDSAHQVMLDVLGRMRAPQGDQ